MIGSGEVARGALADGKAGHEPITRMLSGDAVIDDDTRETLFEYFREKDRELEEPVDRDQSELNRSPKC